METGGSSNRYSGPAIALRNILLKPTTDLYYFGWLFRENYWTTSALQCKRAAVHALIAGA